LCEIGSPVSERRRFSDELLATRKLHEFGTGMVLSSSAPPCYFAESMLTEVHEEKDFSCFLNQRI